MYVFLVTANRIYESVPIDEFNADNDNVFARFLYNEQSEVGVGRVEIISVENRFTAKRQMMATLVVANSQKEMRRVLVFPKKFGSVAGKLKPGNVVRVKLKELDDRSMMLTEIT